MTPKLDLVARAAAITIAALLVVACGGDDGLQPGHQPSTASENPGPTQQPTTTRSPEPTTTSALPSTSTSTTTSPGEDPTAVEQEIVDRYLGFWRARWAANTGTPDPTHPDLPQFATGEQLDAAIAEVEVNLERGLAYREADDPIGLQRVEVISIEAGSAVVQECVVDDGLVVSITSGEVVDDDITTHNIRGELTRVDSVWKVSRIRPLQVWEGVAGCARGA